MTSVGQAMASALVAEGKRGVEWHVALRPVGAGAAVHGLPRPAAHPDRDRERQPRRSARQPGRQGRAARAAGAALELPCPTDRGDWRLRQIVDYGKTAALRRHGARREVPRPSGSRTSHRVHADWVNRKAAPFAFVDPGGAARSVRDLRAARHPADRRSRDSPGEGARSRRRSRRMPAGSWVIKLAQPYGAFAKTMLERQQYPGPAAVPGRTAEAAVRRRPATRSAC